MAKKGFKVVSVKASKATKEMLNTRSTTREIASMINQPMFKMQTPLTKKQKANSRQAGKRDTRQACGW